MAPFLPPNPCKRQLHVPFCCHCHPTATAQALLAQGADTNQEGRAGELPLVLALQQAPVDIALVQVGVRVSVLSVLSVPGSGGWPTPASTATPCRQQPHGSWPPHVILHAGPAGQGSLPRYA